VIFHNNFLHIKRVTKLGNFGEENRAIGKHAVCGMDLRILFMVEVGVFNVYLFATPKQVFTDCDQVLSKF
jgi:hypothetical protein